MSTYTGRYVSSHGSTYNGVPLRVGETVVTATVEGVVGEATVTVRTGPPATVRLLRDSVPISDSGSTIRCSLSASSRASDTGIP